MGAPGDQPQAAQQGPVQRARKGTLLLILLNVVLDGYGLNTIFKILIDDMFSTKKALTNHMKKPDLHPGPEAGPRGHRQRQAPQGYRQLQHEGALQGPGTCASTSSGTGTRGKFHL